MGTIVTLPEKHILRIALCDIIKTTLTELSNKVIQSNSAIKKLAIQSVTHVWTLYTHKNNYERN